MTDVEQLAMTVIRDSIARHPRSLQKMIGPSEIGDPCDRAIIAKLSGTYPEDAMPAWKPAIGVAMHAQAQEWFDVANVDAQTGEVGEVWLTERRVRIATLTTTTPEGDVIEQPLTGTCDLLHAPSGTIIDFKFVGKRRLDHYRTHGPSDVYRTQVHTYGLGYTLEGRVIRNVAILFLPRESELRDAYWWSEPFDPAVATAALERLDRLNRLATNLGPDVASSLYEPCDDPWCRLCRAEKRAAKDAARPNLFA